MCDAQSTIKESFMLDMFVVLETKLCNFILTFVIVAAKFIETNLYCRIYVMHCIMTLPCHFYTL